MTPGRIEELLHPYIGGAPPAVDWPHVCGQLSTYLDLILKWNARTNLTAIREPEEIVRRHFGESLFAASHLGCCTTVLDFGSGAGFPGIPIQLLHPGLTVTLAESRIKKASFLREVVRTLNLPTEVWPNRVESMPKTRQFDTIAMRAVDQMEDAVREAARRTARQLLILTTRSQADALPLTPEFIQRDLPLPGSADGILLIAERI